jgi:type IV fimbrial biogenesis protein FimT
MVELLIVIVVVAVLTSIALPSLTQLQTSNRMVARINKLSVAMHVARNEALKRGADVAICAASADSDGTVNCDGDAAWSEGWLVYPAAAPAEKILVFNGFSGHDRIRSLNGNAVFTFNRYGFSNRTDTLVLCPKDRNQHQARALWLERSGRVRLAEDNDDDGIVEDIDNDNITCPEEE